jgi:hypothetical protein
MATRDPGTCLLFSTQRVELEEGGGRTMRWVGEHQMLWKTPWQKKKNHGTKPASKALEGGGAGASTCKERYLQRESGGTGGLETTK